MQMIERTQSGGEMFAFQSVAEINDYTDPRQFKGFGQDFTFGGANKGQKFENYEQVKERCEKEWAEGIYIFQQFVEKLLSAQLPDTKDKKRRTRFSFTEGDDIDLDRMRNGEAFWRSNTREESTGPTTMTVVIDTTTPYYVNSDDILWRGAAGVALAKILEEKGWSVEIWVVNGSQLYDGERTPVYTACCLKKTSDPLDVSTLINTVSGWFYRSATFTLLDTICQKRGKYVAGGYGSVATPTDEDLDVLSPDEYRVYAAGVFTFDGALGVITDQLEKIRQKAIEESE